MNRFGDIDCSFKRLPPVYGFRSAKLVSIDKALEPIEAQIDELRYYIKIAKKHCHFPNDDGLTKDQAASVYIYTMEWGETTLYRVLNQALRSEDREALKIWFPYLKLFDTALDRLPTVKESVWRGVPVDIGKNFMKNQMFTWWAVSSCSSSVDVIEKFLKNETNSTLFLIEVVNGKKLSGYSQFEAEDEIILRAGTEFRVKANPLKRADGSHIVHLIEIDDDDDQDEVDDDDDQPVATSMKSVDVIPKPLNRQTSFSDSNDVEILSTDNAQLSLILDESAQNIDQLSVKQYQDKVIDDKTSKTSSDVTFVDQPDQFAEHMKFIDVNVDEALKEMKNLMTKMFTLHENTIPRYFFILPAKNYNLTSINTSQNWFDLHFKLYFLCECSDDPKELHIASADGYSIKNLEEFIRRYGQYTQVTLNLVKVLVSTGELVLPSHFQSSNSFNNINYKINVVQKFLDEPKIKQMFASTPLQAVNLEELKNYLNRIDLTQFLGNLYHIVTLDEHIRWVCQQHYDTICSKRNTEFIKQIKAIGGKFNQENKEVNLNQLKLTNANVRLISEILMKGFAISKFVFDNCSISEDDFDILMNIIINRSSIHCLQMHNLNIFKFLGLSKNICNVMKIYFTNQLLTICFTDHSQLANMQIFEKVLSRDKIHRSLCIRASDFLRYEQDCRRYLDSHVSFKDLIVDNVINIDILNSIFYLKVNGLERLKLINSLEIPSVTNEFCQLLKTNQTIVELDLIDATPFSNKDVLKNLFQTLKHHKSIKQLRLHISSIEALDEKETLLINCLQYDRFLTHLCLSQSVISSELVQKLIDAIEKFHSLIHLEFYFCNLNENHVEQLRKLENQGYLFQLDISQQSRLLPKLIYNQTNVYLKSNLNWGKNAKTIAGGNGKGNKLNQLDCPQGFYIDRQQQSIYIADSGNGRIVKWKLGESNGQIIAQGFRLRNKFDQLKKLSDMVVDESNESLIISDFGNRRVIRWSLKNEQDKQILISDIDCWGLVMNENGDLFVSDHKKHEVKRWRKGEKEGTIVAGGNGEGDHLNQLDGPSFFFIDQQDTVYVSDHNNHRVMKWLKGAEEGIVVAGGHGKGSSLKQLSCPYGLIVNEVGDVYVADCDNHRIMCWSAGSKEGCVVVGGNYRGNGSNQFNQLRGLSFDCENNLYVADVDNHRIQRFQVDNK